MRVLLYIGFNRIVLRFSVSLWQLLLTGFMLVYHHSGSLCSQRFPATMAPASREDKPVCSPYTSELCRKHQCLLVSGGHGGWLPCVVVGVCPFTLPHFSGTPQDFLVAG